MPEKRRFALIGCLALIFIITLGWHATFAQSEDQRYFPETGHSVSGDFLEYYQRIPNPEFLHGFPITEAFETDLYGDGSVRKIQYFQRARFLLDESKPPGERVVRTPLGSLLHKGGLSLPLAPNSSACRFFQPANRSRSGHQVCYAFLDFFEQHGGAEQFGYPVSDFELEGELIVQYFEYAKLAWHPEMPAGKKVRLGDLGRVYFVQQREDPEALQPNSTVFTHENIRDLTVRAFPQKAVTSRDDSQTISVIVRDQKLDAIPNVQLTLTFDLPSGRFESVLLDPTDDHGISHYTFSFRGEEVGIAQLKVTARHNVFSAETLTSFRIWW